MAQVLLFTPPNFRGTITNTPSGTTYHVRPGGTVAAEEIDLVLLLSYNFSAAAPPTNSGGGSAAGPIGTIQKSDGSGGFVASNITDEGSGGIIFVGVNINIQDASGQSSIDVDGNVVAFAVNGGTYVAILQEAGDWRVGSPTGPAASGGDVNVSGDFKKNGVLLIDGTTAEGATVGTLTNSPTAGNPTKFLRIQASDGTVYAVPGWIIP